MSLDVYYSRIARLYRETNDSIYGLMPERVNSIFSKIPPGMVLLDAGCGPGVEAKFAASKGIKVIGVDLAPGMVEEFKANVPDAECFVADIRHLPLFDNSVDAVLAPCSLLHLDVEGGRSAIQEFKRISRPGSKLFIGLPVGDGSSCFRVHKIAKHLEIEPIYFHYWERSNLRKILEENGYVICDWEEIPFYEHVPPFGFIEAMLPLDRV